MAVPAVQAVDHQPESLHAVSDLHLFASMNFGMRSAQTDQRLERTNSDGQHFGLSGAGLLVEILLPEEIPHVREQLDGFVGEFGVNLVPAERDVPAEEALDQDFFGLGVGLVHVVLLEDAVGVVLVLVLVGVDDVVVVLLELVETLVGFGRQAVVTCHSLRNLLVLLGTLLVQHDEDQVETGQQ